MFCFVQFEDKRDTVGFKIHSFPTFDKIKKYNKSDDDENTTPFYSIKTGKVKRTIDLYVVATTKFESAFQ
jgi:hypothetical protein